MKGPVEIVNLKALHRAYEGFFGEPDYVLSLSLGEEGDSPGRLDVVYDFPKPAEGKLDTTITTLGLALHPMEGPCERAELSISILGRHSWEENERLGRALGQLIRERLRDRRSFAPDLILESHSLPLFEGMEQLFVLDWGHTEPEWLGDLDPPVRLLEVVPIHAGEVAELAGLDETVRTTVFVQARGAWSDPGRDPLPLLGRAVGSAWERLERWYRERAPAVYADLQPGASGEEVEALQGRLGKRLPRDFVASLKRHNGAVAFHDGYRYLSTGALSKVWAMMRSLKQQGAFSTYEPKASVKDVLQHTWWDVGWVPFAEDGQGNLICVDLNPGPGGKRGQVIYWERVEGPLTSRYGSLFEWLWRYQHALYRGAYVYVAEDGALCAKL